MENYTYDVSPQRRSRLPRPAKLAIIALFVLVIIVVGASLLIPSNADRAASASNQFVKEFITNGDVAKAYALTSSNFKTATPGETFNSEANRLHQFFTEPFKETSKKAYLYPNSWKIDYTGEAKDGTYTLSTIVVKEKNKYVIQYYETARK